MFPDTDLFIAMAFAVVLQIVKDPSRVEKFKRALRKLRDVLNSLPLDDKTP